MATIMYVLIMINRLLAVASVGILLSSCRGAKKPTAQSQSQSQPQPRAAATDAGVVAQVEEAQGTAIAAQPKSVPQESDAQFSALGFGPALFFSFYPMHRVFDEKADAETDLGSVSNFTPGLIVHYGWDFGGKAILRPVDPNEPTGKWKVTSTRGKGISPFIGVFDFEKGINGAALGVLGTYWRGDEKGENRRSLNMGLGATHQRDLFATRDKEGSTVKRRDVWGIAIVMSTTLGL